MFAKGKRRAGPDNTRLRQENRLLEGRIAWYRSHLRTVGELNRTLLARAELAEGLIATQREALDSRAARIAELERRVEASGEATVETPIPLLRDTSAPASQAGPGRPLWHMPGIGPVLNPGQTSWGAARDTAEGAAS
ncbi:hypothetical protein SMD44_00994 [Streptomyces alboflavus]|uniref:Transposase n=1 Tax=Streptomyces alboflavus TaxID=67267 RepID=A0A1Z1W593_9ACTN|nr:hypothetical protein [Streptomyces alboflavus]ARX81596.1 hypothetical protein SMD44_00994 [Streptomyces alboflavus]